MSESIENLRQTARELAERIKTDPAFKAQVEQDPETTLAAAGLPKEVVSGIAEQRAVDGEVSAYIICPLTTNCELTVII